MKLSFKTKITGLAILAAVLPVLVVTILVAGQKRSLMNSLAEELDTILQNDTGEITKLVYRMCEMANRRTERRLQEHLEAAQAELTRLGQPTLVSNQVPWKARNQFTKKEEEVVSLPLMILGDVRLEPNTDFGVPSPLVDVVTRFTHGYCTIFQRMNADGDMLRIATTVRTDDGRRAVGTFIPRRNPDGEENPVVAKVLRGETFVGRAKVLDDWHAAAYAPLWDSPAKREVVGMLFVGFNLKDTLQELREAILATRIRQSGYVYILGAKGDQRGRYIISKDGKSDNEDIWNFQGPPGNYFIQSIVAKALATTNGSLAYERYPWQNKDDRAPRMKTAAVTYFPPWDWVVAASVYDDDYQGMLRHLDQAVQRLLRVAPLGGAVMLFVAVILALVIGSAMARSIGRIIDVARIISDGNLAEAGKKIALLQPHSHPAADATVSAAPAGDEPTQLLLVVSAMTRSLSALVGHMQRASVQMVSTATQIAAASRQQESSVAEFSASTTEIAAAVKEISTTSQELVHTMDDVKSGASTTESLADSGRNSLTAMEGSMRKLAEATTTISDRLAIINAKANNINSMVTTITKVADQTNLLSLNAAIEAEKAGEAGLGFAVVAREIRRLADQTAVASLEIEQTVKEMQGSVTAGVMEMDKFTGEVTRGVESATAIGSQMGRIIEQVKVLMPRFETVSDGMHAQSSGAQQISDAMAQLSVSVRSTSESLKQFHEATAQLTDAARALQQETTRFKV